MTDIADTKRAAPKAAPFRTQFLSESYIIIGKAYPVHVSSCLLKDQITEDAEKYGSGHQQAGYHIQKPDATGQTGSTRCADGSIRRIRRA